VSSDAGQRNGDSAARDFDPRSDSSGSGLTSIERLVMGQLDPAASSQRAHASSGLSSNDIRNDLERLVPTEANVEGLAQRSAAHVRDIRELLVADDVLTAGDVGAVASFQSKHDCDFGEAAERLGLITKEQHARARSQWFGYPCLSPGDRSLDPELDLAYEPTAPFSEALRSLRTDLLACDSSVLVLAIVSPDRFDGRTRLVANLALAFSQTNRPTLLVDCDLRSPRIHKMFRLGNKVGLSSILVGATDEGVVHRITHFPALTVISSGPIPPNPQELLMAPLFGALLDAARQKYSIILLDTPAASYCSDWELVARQAKHTIVLTRRGHTRRPGLEQLTRRLQELDVTAEANLIWS
jgi:chain length determinant protein tyrosine kinase EpsG